MSMRIRTTGSGSLKTPFTSELIPAGTAAAATVTMGGWLQLGGLATATISAPVTGSNLAEGDLQVQYSNDGGATVVVAWANVVTYAAGFPSFTISTTPLTGAITAGGLFVQIRLANGSGSFAATTLGMSAYCTPA